MPHQENDEYYQARAENERAFAARATDPLSVQLHLELAEQYAKVASGEETVARLLSLRDPKYIIPEGGDEST
jgi:hypothetical protein